MKKLVPLVFIFYFFACQGNKSVQTKQSPLHLKCEYLVNPLGIDTQNPGFSWEIGNEQRGARQTAYQILVSISTEKLKKDEGDVWDSGKVNESNNSYIHYSGKPLQSFTRYYWKVKYWNQQDQSSDYSESAWFETAIIHQNEWLAKWIGNGKKAPERDEDFYKEIPNPLLRKTFSVSKSIKEARLYITGLGYFEAYLNEDKIGNDVLHPGWTQYAKRILYSTYDVTKQIKQGENALGVMLGNGWYNPLPLRLFRQFNLREFLTIGQPKLIAQLRILYDDNSADIIKSDESWKVGEGPILKNNVYLGEWYDARKEQAGWNTNDFDDTKWPVAVNVSAPGGTLRAQLTPPNRITRIIKPIALTEPSPGVYVYDLGQNFAGWIRFNLKGKAGDKVKFRYGELLYDNGHVNGMTTVAGQIKEIWNVDGGPGAPKTAYQEDTYILKGKGEEVFQQHFTFHGFRYVEITGLPARPELSALEGLRINADLEKIGNFTCSDTLLNNIQKMVERTFLSNVFSVESDCPGREKFGYGGDIVAAGEAYMFNYDMTNFYRKTVRDFQADARPNGGLTETAPYNGIQSEGFGDGTGPIGWQLAHPFILDKLFQFYDDKKFVEEQYPTVVKLVNFLKTQAKDHLIGHGIGDHVSVDPKPIELTSAAFYYHIVSLCAHFAKILGQDQDYQHYQQMADTIKQAFINRFMQPGTGKFTENPNEITQTFALYYDLVPPEEKEMALQVLIDEITKTHNGHISTGIFGTKMLFDVLRRSNKNQIAYTINSQTDYPSYGFMLKNGATTLWEEWNEPNNQNSKNHPMFGSVSEWFYRALAGINPADDAVAFDKLIIKPLPVEGLSFVKGSYHSIKGLIRSEWGKSAEGFTMSVEIPGNCTAKIYLPVNDPKTAKIVESGTEIYSQGKVNNITGLSYFGEKANFIIYDAGAGKYEFMIQ